MSGVRPLSSGMTCCRPLVSLIILCWAVLIAGGPQARGQGSVAPTSPLVPTAPLLEGILGGGQVELGQPVTLTVNLRQPDGVPSPESRTYEWRKDDVAIPGANAGALALGPVDSSHAGTYTVTVKTGASTSVGATTVTVKPAALPTFSNTSANLVAYVGQTVTFSAAISGSYPRTYQWKRNGGDIANATAATYRIDSLKTTDAGAYVLTVTNPFGTGSSYPTSLTVNAATPPAINLSYPQDWTVEEGGELNLWASVTSGSAPFTYKWYRDGQLITDAADSESFNRRPAALTDAGRYRVVVSNAAGSATSREAVITVRPATPVSIAQHPEAQKVYAGHSASFSVRANGSSPMTFQWTKDGTAILNANTSYFWISATAPTDAGSYAVTVTNVKGAVTSKTALLSVLPPEPPAITLDPANIETTEGNSVSFSAQASGTAPLSFQWFLNGKALGSPTTSNYSPSVLAKLSDGGSYHVVVTNSAGSATSRPATLTVAPMPVPPAMRLNDAGVREGQSFSFNAYGSSSYGPLSFQWYRDGKAIPQATSSDYRIPSATSENAGDYFVVVTNAAGSSTSLAARLNVSGSATTAPGAWLDAQKGGDIVYFLFASPARIERFDCANERWLLPITLPDVPTAFAVGPTELLIAAGRTITRNALDGSTRTPVPISTDTAVSGLALWKDFLLVSHGAYSSRTLTVIRLSTGEQIAKRDMIYSWGPKLAVAPGTGRVFSRTTDIFPSDIVATTVANDGTFGAASDSPYHGSFPDASRIIVSPDDKLAVDDGGIAYHASDLTFAGNLGGGVDDLTFATSGTLIALRGTTMISFDHNIEPSGTQSVTIPARRLFVHGQSIFAFAYPEPSGAIRRAKLPLNGFSSPQPRPVVAGAGLSFTPDSISVDSQGIVYLLSRVHSQVFRWSSASSAYLESIPLLGAVNCMGYSPTTKRLYLGYPQGRIAQIRTDETSPREERFAFASMGVQGLVAADDYLFVNEPRSSSVTYDPNGKKLAQRERSYWSASYVWDPTLRRVYQFRDDTSPNDLLYTEIKADGTLGEQKESPYHGEIVLRPPICVSPDGSEILLGSGVAYAASSLRIARSLPHGMDDAVWIGGRLYTGRVTSLGIEIQRWNSTYSESDCRAVLPGRAVRLFALPENKLLVVSRTPTLAPLFTILDAVLTNTAPAGSGPRLSNQSPSKSVASAGTATLFATTAGGASPHVYAWARNGQLVPSATTATYEITNLQPTHAGIYVGTVTNLDGSVSTTPIILGLTSTAKVVGTGSEVGANIVHPSGRIFDQVSLQGAAASITADGGQVTRLSFVDLNDDIVQVEFSGTGTLTLTLDAPTGPFSPVKYNQPGAFYMKGHASIVVTGADENTHLSVFSVGKANAVNQSLFRTDVTYDGLADIASIAILSRNGKFGGLRCANTSFFASRGMTGVYAPGVTFTGPVYIGEIDAFDLADPVIILGGTEGETAITGGSLAQSNSRPVSISGLTKLRFVDGVTSHGVVLPARSNKAKLEQGGIDVTTTIVVNPGS